jgi:hypothetical protein
MYIIDIHGKQIEVTDLAEAIKQAAMFAGMRHENKAFKKMDEDLKIYWRDIFMKLQNLKSGLNI